MTSTSSPGRAEQLLREAVRSVRRRSQQLAEAREEVASVLFFSFDYPPHDGGVSRLCGAGLGDFSAGELASGSFSNIGTVLVVAIPLVPEERLTMRRPWRELTALRKLRRMGPNSTIICGLWYPEGLLAALAGARPRVILAHGLELRPTRARWRRRLWHWLMRLVLRRASLVVANSRYTADLVRTAAPGTAVVALPLGVDHRRFCPGDRQAARHRLNFPEDKRVIVTVSRILLHKEHRLIFHALATLPESARGSFVHLIAGQGRDMSRLQQRPKRSALGVWCAGWGMCRRRSFPTCTAVRIFSCSARVSTANLQRSRGSVWLSSKPRRVVRLPLAGTRTGGIADAVHEGRGGWLIDQDDMAALRAILLSLVENAEYFHHADLIARQRVENECTWDHYINGFVEALVMPGVALFAVSSLMHSSGDQIGAAKNGAGGH